MRKVFIIILGMALLSAAALIYVKNFEQKKELRPVKITDDIYMLESTRGSYAYIIKSDETVLIDTCLPWKGGAMLREIKSMGVELKQIKHILLTHGDVDHIGNAARLQELTGAEVWASSEDAPVIMGTEDRKGFKKYLKYFFPVKKPKDIKTFSPGQEICGIKVIPAPGHTPGHVCFIYKDVLFAGDLLESKNGKLSPYPKSWNWNNELMQKSVEEIAKLPYRLVCPAHGLPVQRNGQL